MILDNNVSVIKVWDYHAWKTKWTQPHIHVSGDVSFAGDPKFMEMYHIKLKGLIISFYGILLVCTMHLPLVLLKITIHYNNPASFNALKTLWGFKYTTFMTAEYCVFSKIRQILKPFCFNVTFKHMRINPDYNGTEISSTDQIIVECGRSTGNFIGTPPPHTMYISPTPPLPPIF